jgi:HAD superfamily hydrolase (TIGR01549 family)
MRTHDAWLVDLDGTLYFQLPVRVAMAAELLTFGRDAVGTLRHFRKQHERLRDDPPDAMDPYRTQLERTAEAVEHDLETVAALVTEWMHVRPGRWIRLFRRRALLAELEEHRNGGGKIALVSDYPARKKLDALGLTSFFDVVIASGEPEGPRRLKPDPEGYLLAARALSVEPSRCLVIGDREDADGAAARAAQMEFRRIG